MKFLATVFLLTLAPPCFAQFKITKPDKKFYPKNLPQKEKIVNAVRWTDDTGDNMVLLTLTGNTPSKGGPDEGSSDAGLNAYHYTLVGDSTRLTWRVYDYVRDCPVDISLYFVDKSFAVTDLNKDGKAEVWIMYKVSCQGDVSPISMKIVMYEDNKKYALRGTTKVQVAEKKFSGGDFVFDQAFMNGPAVFKTYAERLWQQHKVENWQQ